MKGRKSEAADHADAKQTMSVEKAASKKPEKTLNPKERDKKDHPRTRGIKVLKNSRLEDRKETVDQWPEAEKSHFIICAA